MVHTSIRSHPAVINKAFAGRSWSEQEKESLIASSSKFMSPNRVEISNTKVSLKPIDSLLMLKILAHFYYKDVLFVSNDEAVNFRFCRCRSGKCVSFTGRPNDRGSDSWRGPLMKKVLCKVWNTSENGRFLVSVIRVPPILMTGIYNPNRKVYAHQHQYQNMHVNPSINGRQQQDIWYLVSWRIFKNGVMNILWVYWWIGLTEWLNTGGRSVVLNPERDK